MPALFDLHDVCDVIRDRINSMEELADLHACESGGDVIEADEAELRVWRRCLEVVREASRKESS